jgi:hypothetical protein
LVDFHRLAIPIIVILAIGGIVSFLLAYNFYPKKNVNVNVDDACYELLGSAFDQYKTLDAQRSIRVLQLQLDAIEPSNALIPISYSGTESAVMEFSAKYDVEIIDNKQIGNIDKYVVDGVIQKPSFKLILEDLTAADFDPSNKTVEGTLGMRANPLLTQEEGVKIAQDIKNFMKIGIKNIVENADNDNNNNIRHAECRTSS